MAKKLIPATTSADPKESAKIIRELEAHIELREEYEESLKKQIAEGTTDTPQTFEDWFQDYLTENAEPEPR